MKHVSSLSYSHYVEMYCLRDTYLLLLVVLQDQDVYKTKKESAPG